MLSPDEPRRLLSAAAAAVILLGTALLVGAQYRGAVAAALGRETAVLAGHAYIVEDWVHENADDARTLALLAPRLPRAALAAVARKQDYAAVCLSSPGKRLLAAALPGAPSCARLADGKAVGRSREVGLFAAPGFPSPPLMGFSAPLAGGGMVTHWVSLAATLYPPLAAGNAASRTGETLVVYRDGPDAVFLTPPRFGAALGARPRVSLAGPRVAARTALTAPPQAGRLLDYRGAAVLAATRRLNEVGWGIVHKVDKAEALGGFAVMAAVEAAAALLGVVLVCAAERASRAERRRLAERERGAAHVLRLNRVLSVLSGVNQALVHSSGVSALYDEVCAVAAERGGYPLVWIGFADPADGLIRPAASAGPARGYLEGLVISVADVPSGRGPTGTSLREGRTSVCQDIAADPRMGPWREKALAHGLRSSISLPLRVGGTVAGAFTVYAAEPDFFGSDEIGLLEELAADLAYGVESHGREEARRKAEARLKAERDRLERVTSSVGVGMAVIGPDLRVRWANAVLSRKHGDCVGRLCHEAFHGAAGPCEDCGVLDIFRTGAGRAECERRAVGPDGSVTWTQVIATPLAGGDGGDASAMEVTVPVTERKRLEEQFRQSQKMEAVGRLAGGVAHDFNNLLTAISGYAGLLAASLPADDPKRGDLQEILDAAARAASLTRQLLAFSRRQVLSPRVLDLNALVSELAKMLRRLIGEHIRLTLDLEAGLGPVLADPGQLEQVVLNLAVNARDAMPGGGELRIVTRNAGFKGAPGVSLTVSDSGAGIAPEVLPHVFEPFFTTKEVGKGTGLGLSTVLGIVEQSGGSVEVESRPGYGASFRILLPRAAGTPEAAGAASAPAGVPGGGETVLLVEDDRGVLALARRILRGLGYEVLCAEDAARARAVAAGFQGPIHLLLTDLVMPGLSGRALAEELRRLRPETRVLYMSGYTDDAVVRRDALEAGAPFLQKPFDALALGLKVREVLGPARQPGPSGPDPSRS